MNIGDNIWQLREKQNLTQEQLADKVGVNRNVVTMWETGKNTPPTKYLLAIAETLDCTVDELLGVVEPTTPKPDRPILSNQIRAIRKSRGLTQQDVADVLGCTTTAICYYEQGKRECDYTTLCRLADLLGVTTDALLGREDIEEQDDSTTLKTVIEGSGYSYQQLQEFTGIPKSAIQRYASGTTKKIPADRLRKLYKLLGREIVPTPDHDNTIPLNTKGGLTMNILKAYKAGLEAAQEHENWSRFDCAVFLHGYNPFLTFDELAEITQEIAVELGRKW